MLCQNSRPPESVSTIKWLLFYTTELEVVCFPAIVTGTFNMSHREAIEVEIHCKKETHCLRVGHGKMTFPGNQTQVLIVQVCSICYPYLFSISKCCHLPPNPLALLVV